MSAAIAVTTTGVVEYQISEADIEATRAKYAALEATTPAGYEEVRQAIAVVRTTRTSIEKRRQELKAGALEFGRKVDAEAKRLTTLIESIENPLVAKKQAIDDEKARVKAEAEAARLREIEARLAAERAAEEARLKAIRDEENARLAAERERQETERAALAEERRKLDAERAKQEEAAAAARAAEDARLKAERAELDRQQRELAAQREAAERADLVRKTEAEARERAAREAEEARAKSEAERVAAAEREAYLANIAPDVKKLAALAEAIRALPKPTVKAAAAKRVLTLAVGRLEEIATQLTTNIEKSL